MEHRSFKSLEEQVKLSREAKAPEVNVRARVRMAIAAESPKDVSFEGMASTWAQWFSGIRGGLFAGVTVSVFALAGFFVLSSYTMESEGTSDDLVMTFIEEGDWTELL